MKKRIIIMLFALLLPLVGWCQVGLHVNAVYTGKIVPRDRTVEVKVRGKTLSAYQLTFYHSVRFSATAQQKKAVDNLVDKDRQKAISTELRTKGHSSSLILQLPPSGRTNRYLCYYVSGRDIRWSVTLVYMEGSVGSIDKLRKLIK